MAENREAADRLRRLSYTRRGPEELAGQDARDLIEDRWGDADLDQAGATEGEHFCRPCRRSSTRKWILVSATIRGTLPAAAELLDGALHVGFSFMPTFRARPAP